MRQKAFTTPFLMMLIIAFISLLIDLQGIRYMKRADPAAGVSIWIFRVTILFLAEAIAYWTMRKYITDPRKVWVIWAHIFTLLIGMYVLPYAYNIYWARTVDLKMNKFPEPSIMYVVRAVGMARVICVVSAHIFLGLVIAEAVRKKRAVPAPVEREDHLLDDLS